MKQKPITYLLNLSDEEALCLVTGKDQFEIKHPWLSLFLEVEQANVPEDQEADLFVEGAKQLLKRNDAWKRAEGERFKRNLAEALKCMQP